MTISWGCNAHPHENSSIVIDCTDDCNQSLNTFNRKGKKTLARWDLDINSGKSLRYATIHRAAYRFFSGDMGGLRRPKSWVRIKIGYYDKGGVPDYWGNVTLGIVSQVHIYRNYKKGKTREPNYTTRGIYGCAAHELGHEAHFSNLGPIQYWQVAKYIYESWATYVEWHMTMLEYRGLGLAQDRLGFINNVLTKQWWTGDGDNKEYSPLFIDLVDDLDQRADRDGNTAFPADSVTGYTASRLNQILLDSYGLCSLKSTLKSNKPAGVTDRQIDILFQVYEQKLD